MRDALEDSIERLRSERVTPALLRESEQGEFASMLWNLIEANGFTLALVDEGDGGSGLGWVDVHPLIVAAGRHALALPLPEPMLAAWLLDRAGIDVPGGPLTMADTARAPPLRASRHVSGWRCDGVLPWSPGPAPAATSSARWRWTAGCTSRCCRSPVCRAETT